jgi:hypothetical protein
MKSKCLEEWFIYQTHISFLFQERNECSADEAKGSKYNYVLLKLQMINEGKNKQGLIIIKYKQSTTILTNTINDYIRFLCCKS